MMEQVGLFTPDLFSFIFCTSVADSAFDFVNLGTSDIVTFFLPSNLDLIVSALSLSLSFTFL